MRSKPDDYRCTELEAEALTDLIRNHLATVAQLVRNTERWGAWEALGYPTWEAYAAAELPPGAI